MSGIEPEEKSCGVLIVRGNPIESFLLMKHVDRWDLPKGHVDPGETDIECALREMEEETGISRSDVALDPEFLFSQQYPVKGPRTKGVLKLKTLNIFLGRIEGDPEIVLTEHIGYEWFSWPPALPIQEKTIDPLLKKVIDYLSEK